MSLDFVDLFESLAEHGNAPEDGCSLFGVGYDSEFQQLESKYLVERFARGGSAEKFVIGPFGSGKTHFLRQLMETGRNRNCVTAEIKLNKNLDYSQGLVVYQEIARQVRAPGTENHGLQSLLLEALRRITEKAEAAGLPADGILDGWIAALDDQDLPLSSFTRVLKRGIQDHLTGEVEGFQAAMRWLSGEVTDRPLSRSLGESPVSTSELRIHAHHARLCLYKFIRYAGFAGTIVGFDEAEQGIDVEKKKKTKIFSQLLAEINSIIDLKGGSALIVYAITPDIMTKINAEMPMLAQRLADPGENRGFFDGNVLAPRIDLTRRPDPVDELTRIGARLVELFFEKVADADRTRSAEALGAVRPIAEEVERQEQSSSSRRDMVRRTCTLLVTEYRSGSPSASIDSGRHREAEV